MKRRLVNCNNYSCTCWVNTTVLSVKYGVISWGTLPENDASVSKNMRLRKAYTECHRKHQWVKIWRQCSKKRHLETLLVFTRTRSCKIPVLNVTENISGLKCVGSVPRNITSKPCRRFQEQVAANFLCWMLQKTLVRLNMEVVFREPLPRILVGVSKNMPQQNSFAECPKKH